MDHVFQPDEYGQFDDWSDFNVQLVDENIMAHTTEIFAPSSSAVHVDIPSVSSAEVAVYEMPDSRIDAASLLSSLHPTNSGLNQMSIESRTREKPQKTTSASNKIASGLESVKDRFQSIGSEVISTTKDLKDSAKAKEAEAVSAIKKDTNLVVNKADEALDKVEDSLAKFGHKIGSVYGKAKENVEEVGSKTKESLVDLTSKTKEKVHDAAVNTKEKAHDVALNTKEKVNKLNEKASKEAAVVKKDLKDTASLLKEKLTPPQKEVADVTTIKKETVIIEDWDKQRQKPESVKKEAFMVD